MPLQRDGACWLCALDCKSRLKGVRFPSSRPTKGKKMEVTREALDALKFDIENSTPDWLGEIEVFPTYNGRKKSIEMPTYFNFQRTGWVKIGANKTSDGEIDQHCGMRADWEFVPDLLENVESVKTMMFGQIYSDLADLFLCPTDGDSADPLLHYGDRARFLPRDEVRRMILTGLDHFAPRIAESSPFREEDWYKEWESKNDTKKNS